MKKIMSFILVASIAAILSGCSVFDYLYNDNYDWSDYDAHKSENMIFTARMGDKVQTEFLDFTVLSAELEDTFDGSEAYLGSRFLKLKIKITNKTDYTINAEQFMFEVEYKNNEWASQVFSQNALEDFLPGKTAVLEYVFEVEKDAKDFCLSYREDSFYYAEPFYSPFYDENYEGQDNKIYFVFFEV